MRFIVFLLLSGVKVNGQEIPHPRIKWNIFLVIFMTPSLSAHFGQWQ